MNTKQTTDPLLTNREKIQSGIAEVQKQNPKLTYTAARDIHRARNLAMYGCDALEAPVVKNSALRPDRREERNAFVQSVQSGRRGMSFSDAWNQARGLRPDLFLTA